MKKSGICRVDLALQGGGAHGAFTWGVLDRLLEDERIEIGAISGTSAGAMNAVVLADGLMAGGRVAAREGLRRFWTRVSQAAGQGPGVGNPFTALFGNWAMQSAPVNAWFDFLGKTLSPYQTNPLDINPLREVVASEIDFERVRRCDKVRVFVSATHVRTGKLREFSHQELSVDALMASACLPLLFQAVEIDGEAYWDGGYVGNPSLMPLIVDGPADDLILVQINPSHREVVPTAARDIVDRLDEITFNSSLVKELRAIAMVRGLLELQGTGRTPMQPPLFEKIAALRMHRIEATQALSSLGIISKVNAAWPLLQDLHRIGHTTADAWIDRHFDDLGRRSTLPLEQFLG